MEAKAVTKYCNKKAIITGATGYVGSNLTRKLLFNGWEVDAILRPDSNAETLLRHKNLNIFIYDNSYITMNDIFSTSKPDVVFHVASMVVGEHKPEQVHDLISSNVTFGAQILEAMVANNVSRIINTSTYWEHYENKKYSPVNLYAATKKAFCDILKYYVEAKGVCAVTLELFDLYGPNDPRPKLLNLLINAAKTGEVFSMSPGEQKIDLIYIDDLTEAYIIAANKLLGDNVVGHEIYSISSGSAVTLKELVRLLQKRISKELNIKWGARPYKNREVMAPYKSYEYLPSWKAETSLESGLDELVSSEAY